MNEKKIEPTEEMVGEAANALFLEVTETPLRFQPTLTKLSYLARARMALRAALNHPDARGLFVDEDDRPWEPLDGRPLRAGYEVRRDYQGITRIAVVGRVDEGGDPWAAEGGFIGSLGVGTWYFRRPVQELPTKCGTVIVANDGHKFIKAEVDGIAHRAREAVLGANGWWYGAWRKAEGDGLLSAMFPEHISAPTWKVDDQ